MGQTASASGAVVALIGKQVAPEALGYLTKLILAPEAFEFATDTLALTENEWLSAINNVDGTRLISLPVHWEIEPTKEDDVYATSSTGNVDFIRTGKLTQKYMVKVTPFEMAQLNNLNGAGWNVFEITSNGFIKGTSIDKVKFQPQTLQNFRVEGETPAAGEENAIIPISLTYGDPKEWNSRPSFVQPLIDGVGGIWNPLDLVDPKALLSTITDASTAGFTIALEGYDGVPFEGASKEDVKVAITSTGVLVPIDTLTESATIPGTYAAVVTLTSVSHLIGAAPVGTALATQGYAGLEADLVTEVIS